MYPQHLRVFIKTQFFVISASAPYFNFYLFLDLYVSLNLKRYEYIPTLCRLSHHKMRSILSALRKSILSINMITLGYYTMKQLRVLLTLPLFAVSACLADERHEKKGWDLTFYDEFNGNRLNTHLWEPMDPWQQERNKEMQAYVRDAFVVHDGVLRIVANEQRASYDGKVRDYVSGMKTTQGRFSQQYGWFEIRAKVPKGRGLWPAFWLLSDSLTWPPEIDVMEILGHETDKVYFNNHWLSEEGGVLDASQNWKGPDFSAGFHVFAVEWGPDAIIWYVDGVERARLTENIPHEPMFILVNLAVGGVWPGAPNTLTGFPASFDIDYVRVYEKNDLKLIRQFKKSAMKH